MIEKRKNNRTRRCGFTTGACAAAAARAATLALLKQEIISRVQISLPNGTLVAFQVNQCLFDHNQGTCSVIKDAGDDPDITNGIEIWARVSRQKKPGVLIEGGAGVGTVTKPGLEIPVGSQAINPVPRQMITGEVNAAAGERPNGNGFKVVISAPKGEELARRTLNPRLGITGGISILGTTGIVIPYSVNAYTTCISRALDVAVACGCREAVLTTGRRSEKFAQRQLSFAEECFIQAGDFIGFSLEECRRKRFTRVIVWGMIGKLTKLAGGHLYTHVSDSAVDIKLLVEIAREVGVSEIMIEMLANAVSANHFRELLPPQHLAEFASRLCRKAAQKCRESVEKELKVECILSDYDGNILGRASE